MLLIWQKRPGSPKPQNEKSNAKPPLPNNTASQFRKGAYHESLDFVLSLCETSYGLVDVFPVDDRKSALCEVIILFFLFLFLVLSLCLSHICVVILEHMCVSMLALTHTKYTDTYACT